VRLVATRSTTWDHIDLPACAQRGVTVCGVSTYGDHTVPEHAFALLLALARRLREAMDANRNGDFSYAAMRGTELRGKTLGIIGAGRVGRAMAPIAHGFGMEVIAFDPELKPGAAEPAGYRRVDLPELLRRSHVISLHARLTPETYHLLDRTHFAQCRRGVLIINTARGRLIDTAALVEALDEGIVAGVGFDVLGEESIFHRRATAIISNHIVERLRGHPDDGRSAEMKMESEPVSKLLLLEDLLSRPNVVFTPHTAFNTVEAVERINRATVENIRAFLAGTPTNVLPSTPSPPVGTGEETFPAIAV
jgi:D-lactate dehydrogenase